MKKRRVGRRERGEKDLQLVHSEKATRAFMLSCNAKVRIPQTEMFSPNME